MSVQAELDLESNLSAGRTKMILVSKPTDDGVSVSATIQVPFLDLQAQFAGIRAEMLSSVERVLESQHFILGSEVKALEADVAHLVECQFAIGCASGSDALLLALMAMEIGSGDEVITTPFTFIATAGSIARVGARPVFVDISPDDLNLDPRQIEKVLTPRTRAILPVHLFGRPADMGEILEIAGASDLPVIEDAAQSIGARWKGRAVGSLGRIGCFSFFPSKNLGGAGDGGMVTTNDPALADRLRVLRVHGSRSKYQYELVGINSRLDELQAAILRVKLPHLEKWTALRERNAERYRSIFHQFNLDGVVQLPSARPDGEHVYNQFIIRTPQRNELREYMSRKGIGTEVYYPRPLHLQDAFAYLGYKAGDFPEAERASSEVMALPIYSELTEDQQQHVVSAIATFFDQ
jgi:dTDP-4-amino-4,6-dideoxygalactose transaminase